MHTPRGETGGKGKDYLFCAQQNSKISIPFTDIAHICSLDSFVRIHFISSESVQIFQMARKVPRAQSPPPEPAGWSP